MRFPSSSLLTLILVTVAAPAPAQNAANVPAGFAAFVEQTAPAVVTVRSAVGRAEQGSAGEAPPGVAASGFVIGPGGLIATHAAVAADAQQVSVALADGTSFDAEVLGTDEQTGVALIRARGARTLPALSWGSTEALATGEWVVALGRPQPETPTVSVGVVSAPPAEFVNAEVAIGTGNAGGPLLSTAGRIVGFNTILPDAAGVPQGAILPAERVRPVLQELAAQAAEAERRPARLGVSVQAVNAALARAFGIEPGTGVLVAGVEEGSPAARAGVEPGDVITSFMDEAIASPQELREKVEEAPVGDQLALTVRRGGEDQTLSLALGADQPPAASAQQRAETEEARPRLGIRVADLNPDMARQLGLGDVQEGVVVVAVREGGMADQAGIEAGDVIVSVGREPIRSTDQLLAELQAAQTAEQGSTVLRVYRDGSYRFVPLET